MPSSQAHRAERGTPATPRQVRESVASRSLLFRVYPFPGPDALPGGIEQAFVVALAQLLARRASQLREERRVLVVDLEVFRLVGRRDLVGPEQESIGIPV